MSDAEQYYVVAGDGKEYGPADLATLRQWVGEGRVVRATHIRRAGSPVTFAGKMPELADLFPGSAAPAGAPAGAVPAAGPALVLPAEFRVWDFIGAGWTIYKRHWTVLTGIVVVQILINVVANLILRRSGGLVDLIIGGPIQIGIWRATLAAVDGREPDVGMMFSGFDRFLDGFLAKLVTTVLIILGLLCLIVPGIILALMWVFTFGVLMEQPIGFWEAMRESARLSEGYRWRLFLMVLASILVALLGLLALCVGLLFAIPVIYVAFAVAYRFLQSKKAQPVTAPA